MAIGGDALLPTIEAVLAARLEGLGAEERALLEQRLGGGGRSFHRGAVATLPGRDALAGADGVARAQLIQPDARSTSARTPSASATR